mmetsp:Transcript_14390/g.37343  ORF Transcript_14390/g.37343 Transcript_14390/m.37343 type:complete len:226 (+) Transcript_14390:119-796(+)
MAWLWAKQSVEVLAFVLLQRALRHPGHAGMMIGARPGSMMVSLPSASRTPTCFLCSRIFVSVASFAFMLPICSPVALSSQQMRSHASSMRARWMHAMSTTCHRSWWRATRPNMNSNLTHGHGGMFRATLQNTTICPPFLRATRAMMAHPSGISYTATSASQSTSMHPATSGSPTSTAPCRACTALFHVTSLPTCWSLILMLLWSSIVVDCLTSQMHSTICTLRSW